jgi:hypothetical protein
VIARRVRKYSVFLVSNGFLFAVFVSLAQFSQNPYLSWAAFELSYVAFPFLIISIFLAACAYSWPLVKRGWRRRNWKLLSWAAGAGYALFYVFATNTISVSEPGVAIPANLSNGYVVFLAVYGPMAVWPDVEFYFPRVMNLTGYLSVGNVILIVSLGVLMAFAFSLLLQIVSVRLGSGKGAAAFIGGTVLAALSTNACCCCTPVLLPVLALLLGSSSLAAITYELVDPASPLSNLLVIATLGSLVASITLSTRWCCRPGLEEVAT